jgi:hypothetical protein
MKDGREYGLYGDYSVDEKTKKAVFEEKTERYRCRHCGKDFFEYEKPVIHAGKEPWRTGVVPARAFLNGVVYGIITV